MFHLLIFKEKEDYKVVSYPWMALNTYEAERYNTQNIRKIKVTMIRIIHISFILYDEESYKNKYFIKKILCNDDKFYIQPHGIQMGFKCGLTLANLYLNTMEKSNIH